MDFLVIFATLLRWTPLALGGGLLALLLMWGGYALYKRRLHGARRPRRRQWVACFLLSCWLLLVFALTTLSRGANYTGRINIALFTGHINAWNQWSLTELELILFNMLMFAPLGFLLPLLWRRAERFPVTALISLAVTGGIELIQLLTGKGIFELDDLLHNWLGSLFGYFCIMAILTSARRRCLAAAAILKALIVPALTGAAVGAAVVAYTLQPYGNMPILPAQPQDMSQVDVRAELELPAARSSASVYQNIHAGDSAFRQRIVEQLAELESLSFSRIPRIDGDNRVVTGLNADGQQVQLTCFTRTGTWSYTNWQESARFDADAAAAQAERLERWLSQNDLLPAGAVFSSPNQQTLRWDCAEPAFLAQQAADFDSGVIMAQLDAQGNLASFDYLMNRNRFVAEVEICSPAEAFERVLAGAFEQYIPFQPGDVLTVTGCQIRYVYDTKGFYQPVYEFSGSINGDDSLWQCQIPARL